MLRHRNNGDYRGPTYRLAVSQRSGLDRLDQSRRRQQSAPGIGGCIDVTDDGAGGPDLCPRRSAFYRVETQLGSAARTSLIQPFPWGRTWSGGAQKRPRTQGLGPLGALLHHGLCLRLHLRRQPSSSPTTGRRPSKVKIPTGSPVALASRFPALARKGSTLEYQGDESQLP